MDVEEALVKTLSKNYSIEEKLSQSFIQLFRGSAPVNVPPRSESEENSTSSDDEENGRVDNEDPEEEEEDEHTALVGKKLRKSTKISDASDGISEHESGSDSRDNSDEDSDEIQELRDDDDDDDDGSESDEDGGNILGVGDSRGVAKKNSLGQNSGLKKFPTDVAEMRNGRMRRKAVFDEDNMPEGGDDDGKEKLDLSGFSDEEDDDEIEDLSTGVHARRCCGFLFVALVHVIVDGIILLSHVCSNIYLLDLLVTLDSSVQAIVESGASSNDDFSDHKQDIQGDQDVEENDADLVQGSGMKRKRMRGEDVELGHGAANWKDGLMARAIAIAKNKVNLMQLVYGRPGAKASQSSFQGFQMHCDSDDGKIDGILSR